MKAFLFLVGCVLAWTVLLPVVVIGGGLALFAYAAGAELGQFMIGIKEQRIDQLTAHKMARQICFYPVRHTRFAGI
jgi:hypothetical protein